MIKKRGDLANTVRPKLKGGVGEVKITEYVNTQDAMVNCRLLCEQEIPVGGSIGKHMHLNETEYYLIRSGRGLVIENHGEYAVGPGDIVVTGHMETHGIVNTGDIPLTMTAIIVTH